MIPAEVLNGDTLQIQVWTANAGAVVPLASGVSWRVFTVGTLSSPQTLRPGAALATRAEPPRREVGRLPPVV
jgi:hypothetical protein